MLWLTEACKKTNTNNYGDLVEKVLGKNWSRFHSVVVIIFNSMLTMVTYLLVIASSVP